MGLAVLFLLVFLPTGGTVTSDDGCAGGWSNDTAAFFPSSKQYALRSAFQQSDPESIELREQLCPAETLMHNCYFHNLTARARRVERRQWVLPKPYQPGGCLPFWPASFLHSMRTRHLLMLGDSSTMQLWSSFACSLFAFTPSHIRVEWDQHRGGTMEIRNSIYNNRTCPYEDAKHCHIRMGGLGAAIKFPGYKSKITFEWVNNPPTVQQIIKHNLSAHDIVVVNFGLHYNNESHFKDHLSNFADEVHSLLSTEPETVPLLFFRESFPTHFSESASSNGYFIVGNTSRACAPYNDTNVALNSSWRNSHFALLPTEVKVIKISHGLSSQWDAHVDGDSTTANFGIADCAHWCNPSGAMEYVKMMMYNAIRKAFNQNRRTKP